MHVFPFWPLCVGWKQHRWPQVRIWRWSACVWRAKCPTSGVPLRGRQRLGSHTKDTNMRPRSRQPLPVHPRWEGDMGWAPETECSFLIISMYIYERPQLRWSEIIYTITVFVHFKVPFYKLGTHLQYCL